MGTSVPLSSTSTRGLTPAEKLGMVYVALDCECIGRDPNNINNLAAVGWCAMRADGTKLDSGKIWLAFTEGMVDLVLKEEFLDKNPGLLESWLAESRKSFDRVVEEYQLGNLDINVVHHREAVNRYLRSELARKLEDLEIRYGTGPEGQKILRYLSDFSEFDVARVERFLYLSRLMQLAEQTGSQMVDDAKVATKATWVGAAINADNQYAVFLEPDRQWGFGKELAKRLGVELPPNRNPHDPEADAEEIVAHYCILMREVAHRVKLV